MKTQATLVNAVRNILAIAGPVAMTSALLVACSSPPTSYMMNPKPAYEKFSENGGGVQFDITPKAEILVVVDTSDSMLLHPQMADNINRFVDEFTRKNPIEYHLAVVSIYDHRTYDSQNYKTKFAGTDKLNTFENGEFRPVKDGPNSIVKDKFFISSADANLKDLLKNTINIGVQSLKNGGPEFEESFSPVAAAFNLPGGDKLSQDKMSRQSGFFFGPNAYKIIFFVTDATDDSRSSASELYYSLLASANGDRSKVMIYGAVVPTDDNSCVRDPGGPPVNIEDLLHRASIDESNVVTLCKPFGDKLAEIGKSIRTRTLPKVISLSRGVPMINGDPSATLTVCYGIPRPDLADQPGCPNMQQVPFETSPDLIGFQYDPTNNSVHLNPNLELNPEPGGKLIVKYKSVNPSNLRTGYKVKRYGDRP